MQTILNFLLNKVPVVFFHVFLCKTFLVYFSHVKKKSSPLNVCLSFIIIFFQFPFSFMLWIIKRKSFFVCILQFEFLLYTLDIKRVLSTINHEFSLKTFANIFPCTYVPENTSNLRPCIVLTLTISAAIMYLQAQIH